MKKIKVVMISFILSFASQVMANNFSLRANDMPIRKVIEMISDATGESYVIDPRVVGNITMMVNTDSSKESLERLLVRVLGLSDYTIVDSNGIKTVVPVELARTEPAQLINKEEVSEGFVTRVFSTPNGLGKDISTMIRALVSKGGYLNNSPTGDVLIVVDKKENIDRLETIIKTLVKELVQPQDKVETRVYRLENQKSSELVKSLQSMIEEKDGKSKVVSDELSNSLIITAPSSKFKSVESVISKLDYKRSQVIVEAVIAEVSVNNNAAGGVQTGLSGDGLLLGALPSGNGTPSALSLMANWPASLSSITSTALAGGVLTLGDVNLGVLAQSLKNDAQSNILSTPSITTLDGEKAEIVVGQNVPFVTGSYAGVNNDINPFQTISREDIGLKLSVLPELSESGIKLSIEQEISSLSPSTTSASDLITNKRFLKTRVQLKDGEVIALGGLLDQVENNQKNSSPFLSSIPVLGDYLKHTSADKQKRNLVIFIRTRILKDDNTISLEQLNKYKKVESTLDTESGLKSENKKDTLSSDLKDVFNFGL